MSVVPRPDRDDLYRAGFAVGFLLGSFLAAVVARVLFL